MKKVLSFVLALLFVPVAFAAPPAAPAPHFAAQAQVSGVVLTWTASVTSGVTYSLYRVADTAGVACPTALTSYGAAIVSGVTGLSYTDPITAVGAYCYVATASGGGQTSGPSNTASVTISPQPPTGLSAVQ